MSRKRAKAPIHAAPARRQAAPSISMQSPSARLADFNQWLGLTNVTPARAKMITVGAVTGDLASQWELFATMEDTWYRLQKNLNSVKNVVKRIAWSVSPVMSPEQEDASPEAADRADLVKLALTGWRPEPGTFQSGFEDCLYHILDAMGKGLSVQQLDWELRDTPLGDRWLPKASQLVSQRLYGWNPTGTRLGMINAEAGGTYWHPFEPGRVLVSQWHCHSAAPGATAMLRPLVPYWIGRTYGWQWLLQNAQIFGVPFRWATYDANQPDLQAKLAEMLENLGTAGWAAFPSGTTLDFKEAVTNATGNPQQVIQDLADKACDILILGQTLTTDAGDRGTQALGTVHAGVRQEVLQSAAWWVADVLNYQLVPAVLEYNYGDITLAPVITPDLSTDPDPVILAQRDEILSRMGMRLPEQFMHERHQVPMPSPDEPVLSKPAAPIAVQPGQPGNEDAASAPDAAPVQSAAAPSPADRAHRRIKNIVSIAIAQSVGARRRWLEPLSDEMEKLIQAAQSWEIPDEALVQFLEQAQRKMPALFHRMDHAALAKSLEGAMGAAAVAGLADGLHARPR